MKRAASLISRVPALFRAYDFGESVPYRAERSSWHLLFPLGGKETWIVYNFTEDETGALTEEREEIVVEYDEEWLGAILDNWRRMREHQMKHGASPKGVPVSYQHRIEERMFIGWETGHNDPLKRAGTCFDLHLHTEEGSAPRGLYGLVEWTPKAIEAIEAGEWLDISPTTCPDWRIDEGDVLEGENIIALGLVDRGFLDTIGTARDGLPADAFGGAPRQRSFRVGVAGMHAPKGKSTKASQARSAPSKNTHGDTMENPPEETAPPTDGEGAGSTQRAEDGGDASIEDAIEAALEPFMSRMDKIEERMDEMYARMEGEDGDDDDGSASRSAGSDDAEGTTSDATEDDVEGIARAAAAKSRRLAATDAASDAQTLVKERKLRPGDVQRYVRLRTAGEYEAADALVGEIVSSASGAGASTGEPPSGKPADPNTVNMSELVARARKALGEQASEYAVLRQAESLATKARKANKRVQYDLEG